MFEKKEEVRKKEPKEIGQIESITFYCEPKFKKNLIEAVKSSGLNNVSAYCRLAVQRYTNQFYKEPANE